MSLDNQIKEYENIMKIVQDHLRVLRLRKERNESAIESIDFEDMVKQLILQNEGRIYTAEKEIKAQQKKITYAQEAIEQWKELLI